MSVGEIVRYHVSYGQQDGNSYDTSLGRNLSLAHPSAPASFAPRRVRLTQFALNDLDLVVSVTKYNGALTDGSTFQVPLGRYTLSKWAGLMDSGVGSGADVAYTANFSKTVKVMGDLGYENPSNMNRSWPNGIGDGFGRGVAQYCKVTGNNTVGFDISSKEKRQAAAMATLWSVEHLEGLASVFPHQGYFLGSSSSSNNFLATMSNDWLYGSGLTIVASDLNDAKLGSAEPAFNSSNRVVASKLVPSLESDRDWVDLPLGKTALTLNAYPTSLGADVGGNRVNALPRVSVDWSVTFEVEAERVAADYHS